MVRDVNYFGTLMVAAGLADGMVSGANHTTAATIRPAFEIIKTVPGVSVASSVFFMLLADRVLVYGDCAVNPDPDAAQLADIALSSAQTAAAFGIEPRVAMLSYSTGSSGAGADVEKVAAATALVRERRPGPAGGGPDPVRRGDRPGGGGDQAARQRGRRPGDGLRLPRPEHRQQHVQGGAALGDAVAVGPVMQGLRRPVNDLSRGATVKDIVNTVAITAIQAADGHEDPGAQHRLLVGEVPPLRRRPDRRRKGLIEQDRRARRRRGRPRGRAAPDHGRRRPGRPRRGRAPGGARRQRVRPRRRVIDDDVVAAIERLVPLAPLHNPAALAGIAVARKLLPDVPQVAVFDTAFHATIPPEGVDLRDRRRRWPSAGRSAGTASTAPRTRTWPGGPPRCWAGRRTEVNVITLHLGNGASACAVEGGRSVATSMGLSPQGGLVMGTRSGDVDPTVVFHLHRVAGMPIDEIERLARPGTPGCSG